MKALLCFLEVAYPVESLVTSDSSLKGLAKLLQRFLQVLTVAADVCHQLLSTITNDTTTSSSSFYYFDPNAMDCKCQTHSTYVWETLAWLKSNDHFLDSFSIQIKAQTLLVQHLWEEVWGMHAQKAITRRDEMVEKVMELLGKTTVKKMLGQYGHDAEGLVDEAALRLRVMLVYFFLSYRRGHNSNVLSEKVSQLVKQLLNNKTVYYHLKLYSATHSTNLERKWANNCFPETVDLCHNYLLSFVVNINYWIAQKVPMVAFIVRQCAVHKEHNVKFGVNWNNQKPILTPSQLNSVGNPVGSFLTVLNSDSPSSPSPFSVILSFESKPLEVSVQCSLPGWLQEMTTINFTNLLLSYAYCHQPEEHENPPFNTLEGCTLNNCSTALLKHVYSGIVPAKEIAWKCKC